MYSKTQFEKLLFLIKNSKMQAKMFLFASWIEAVSEHRRRVKLTQAESIQRSILAVLVAKACGRVFKDDWGVNHPPGTEEDTRVIWLQRMQNIVIKPWEISVLPTKLHETGWQTLCVVCQRRFQGTQITNHVRMVPFIAVANIALAWFKSS